MPIIFETWRKVPKETKEKMWDLIKVSIYIAFNNVLKTRLDIKLEKLSVQGSLVKPTVEPRSNR